MSTKTKKTTPKSKKAARAEGAARTERLRKAALAEVQTRLAGEPGEKPARAAKPKRLSALDAASRVLADSGQPMRATELIAEMEAKGLWKSPGGKTPEATLYAAMTREIAAKGDCARFKKHAKGVFVAA